MEHDAIENRRIIDQLWSDLSAAKLKRIRRMRWMLIAGVAAVALPYLWLMSK